MAKRRILPKITIGLSTALVILGLALISSTYMLNKRIGLGYATLIRDLFIEISGAYLWGIVILLFGAAGYTLWFKKFR